MYYAWNWWWFVSFIVPMLLIAWIIFSYGTGRYRSYRGTYEPRDRDDWLGPTGAERELHRPEYRGRGPHNYRRTDGRIFEDVCERLMLDDRVDARNIEVDVVDSRVLLRGSVASRAERRAAEMIAEMSAGVTDVENELRVGGLPPAAGHEAGRSSLPA